MILLLVAGIFLAMFLWGVGWRKSKSEILGDFKLESRRQTFLIGLIYDVWVSLLLTTSFLIVLSLSLVVDLPNFVYLIINILITGLLLAVGEKYFQIQLQSRLRQWQLKNRTK